MLKEIYPDIWLIQVPLPKSPLRYINSYLIKGDRSHLLIDTGFNCPESEDFLRKSIENTGVDIKDLDIFLTHSHSDHTGLAGKLISPGRTIFTSREALLNINRLTSQESSKAIFKEAHLLGFKEEVNYYLDIHPGLKFSNDSHIKAQVIGDNHPFKVGVYEFFSISAPGHAPGMMCLYEKNHKILFSGDHILDKITPNISCWSLDTNPLMDYFQSLQKVADLPVNTAFSSHRGVITNFKERVETLRKHSLDRLDEVRDILSSHKALTPYEVASKLTWNVPQDRWEDIHPVQHWFATGEAMANLTFLYHMNEVSLTCDLPYTFTLNI